MLVLAEISPLDTVSGNRVTLRACSSDDRTITGLNGVRWWPAMSKTPTLSIQLFEGDWSSDVQTGSASFTLLTDKLARLDANARRYRWAGAPVTIYAGLSGDAWPWTTYFVGRVDTFQAKGNSLDITAKVDDQPFQANALTLTYAGTGGLEGGTDLTNKVKPWVLGAAANVQPVLIDSVNNVFQFSAYGPIQAVTTLYERASDFGASVGDFASYAALVAATIPNGRWGTCIASGLVRLGAPPFGVITGDVQGDANGGTFIRKTGAIISRIATQAGLSTSYLDTASLAALDTALPYNVNCVLTEQTTVIDIAKALAQPLNAQAIVSLTGQLFVCRVNISASGVLTLDAQGRQKPKITGSTENNVSPPYWRVEFGAQRSWYVHSFSDIAWVATLNQRGAYVSSNWYRPGDIVQNQNASWIYTGSTPGTGNAPPTLPTSSNSFWTLMQAGSKVISLAIDRSQITYDGTGALVPSSQTINFTINAQNLSTSSYTVSLTDGAGNVLNANTYLTAAGGGTFSPSGSQAVLSGSPLFQMTAANFNSAIGVNSAQAVVVTVSHPDGVSDARSVVKSQAGATAKTVYISSNLQAINFDSTGAVVAGQTITFTANKQNTTNTVTWTVVDSLGNTLTASSYLSATTGDSVTMTGTQFASALAVNGATAVTVIGTISADSLSDKISVSKVSTGNVQVHIFMRASAPPSTPTGNSPAGWISGAVPNGAGAIYESIGTKDTSGNLVGSWSTPNSITSFNPRGDYNSGNTYYLNDVVTYSGGTYIALQNNFSGQAPSGTGQATAYWSVVASPGNPGTPATPPSGFSATINLTSGAAVNLRTVANANGYTGASNATITFNVPSGVTIRGLNSGGIGIDSGTWPASSYTITLTLVVQSGGIVDGGGGNGGNADGVQLGLGSSGNNGGDAIYCRVPMTVTINSGGTVRAGGGGGGGGTAGGSGSPNFDTLGGGGGGGGAPNGSGGAAGTSTGTVTAATNGSAGTTGGGGSGGAGAIEGATHGGAGGGGGTFGAAGSGNSTYAGGSAGFAVRKNGNTVTVTNSGTMTGTAA
ncbi:MAG TPA: hypothetical protein VFW19_10575 [Allosphingosinicella sp.]|nr:hypothetical protein [Allosphingosinicella sp.]